MSSKQTNKQKTNSPLMPAPIITTVPSDVANMLDGNSEI